MTKRHTNRKSRSKNVFQNPVVVGAIITGFVGVLVAFIQVLPQLKSSPIVPTQPLAVTENARSSATFTQTEAPPTSTVAADSTSTVIPSETPTLPLPALTCLSSWLRVDTGGRPTPTVTATPSIPGDCSPVLLDLGISSGSERISFSQTSLKGIQGLFGISRRIDSGNIIELNLTSKTLFNADFWVAISTGANPVDSSVDVIYIRFVSESQTSRGLNGTIAIYRGAEKIEDKKWTEIIGKSAVGPPFTYNVKIRVDGGRVVITVNDREVADEPGIFPTYLFFGYNKESPVGSVVVDVDIDDLTLKPVK